MLRFLHLTTGELGAAMGKIIDFELKRREHPRRDARSDEGTSKKGADVLLFTGVRVEYGDSHFHRELMNEEPKATRRDA